MKSQKPISLENLPEYLKSLKDGSAGSSPVVDMGQIVTPKRSFIPQILAALLVCIVLGVSSVATYNVMSTKQLTVVVDVTNPQTIPQIVADSGGEVLAVKQMEGSTYEVKVSTRKSGHVFLEWLRRNRDVKKAALEE